MLEAALTFALALAGYAYAAAPSVTFGDAGEFAAAAATLALPHAPDYPFYTLAARAFGTLVPLGNWAYRTNLFSAACAAAALAVLGDALRRLGVSRPSRLAAVLALGACPLWRWSAGVTEVFSLHWLVCACVLWVLARHSGRVAQTRAAAALGLCFGLGSAAHQTLALAAPAVLAQAGCESASWGRRLRALGVLLAFAAAGFSVYAYLPLRAAHSPPLDWGHPVDPPRFLHAVLRRDYGSLTLTVQGRAGAAAGAAADRLAAQAARWASESARQLGWLLLLLAAVGLSSPGLPRGARWAAAVWVLCAGPLFLCLGDPPFDAQTSGALDRFYGASWLALALLAAAGADALGARRRWAGAAAAAALALSVLRPEARAAGLERGDLAAYDYGRSVQDAVPPGGALFMDGGDDTFYALAFLDFAQGRRPDIELHDRGGVVFPSAYGAGFRSTPAPLKEPIRQAVERPLAESGRLFYSTLNSRLLPGFELKPWGLLRRPMKPGARAEDAALWAAAPWRFDERLLRARYRDRALAALYPLQRALSRSERGDFEGARGDLALSLAWAPDALWVPGAVAYAAGAAGYAAARARRWPEAEDLYRVWARAAPGSAQPRVNLGVAAQTQGRLDEAERLFREAVALEPDSAGARYALGARLFAAGRFGAAAEQLLAAHRLAPGEAAYARWAAEAQRKAR